MAIRWGICGAGLISSDFCSAVKTLPPGEHEILAVAAMSNERAEDFAEKFGIKNAYGSYQELADNPDIDVIYIGVVSCSHVPLTKLMLNSGHHVLCEKPMAICTNQALEVFELARQKAKFFMEAIWSGCFPIYDAIKQKIYSGSIGDVRLVTATMCFKTSPSDWAHSRKLGGGCLITLGFYAVYFANLVFKNEKPENIIAYGNLNEDGVDIDGTLILSYKNGARAVLTYSIAIGDKQCAAVYGSKGMIDIPEKFYSPAEATLSGEKITNKIPEGPVPFNYPNSGGLSYEADHVRKCIQAGKTESPSVTFYDSETVYYIMDEARRQMGVKYDCE